MELLMQIVVIAFCLMGIISMAVLWFVFFGTTKADSSRPALPRDRGVLGRHTGYD